MQNYHLTSWSEDHRNMPCNPRPHWPTTTYHQFTQILHSSHVEPPYTPVDSPQILPIICLREAINSGQLTNQNMCLGCGKKPGNLESLHRQTPRRQHRSGLNMGLWHHEAAVLPAASLCSSKSTTFHQNRCHDVSWYLRKGKSQDCGNGCEPFMQLLSVLLW